MGWNKTTAKEIPSTAAKPLVDVQNDGDDSIHLKPNLLSFYTIHRFYGVEHLFFSVLSFIKCLLIENTFLHGYFR